MTWRDGKSSAPRLAGVIPADEHEPPEAVLRDLRERAVADANGTELRFGKSEDAVADGADDSTMCNAEGWSRCCRDVCLTKSSRRAWNAARPSSPGKTGRSPRLHDAMASGYFARNSVPVSPLISPDCTRRGDRRAQVRVPPALAISNARSRQDGHSLFLQAITWAASHVSYY